MPTDSRENRRPTKHQQVGALPPEPEQLPCPRCDSTNTKFCYYNNYNFSQPRHFCKSCRRYWTHGGTLRDIPVGGGSRKNAKRSRTAVVSPASLSYPSARSAQPHHNTSPANTPLFVSLAEGRSSVPFVGDGKPSVSGSGSFTSLLNTQGSGFLALGGLGFGFGPEFEDVGFGLGRAVWPFPGDYIGGAASTASVGGGGGGAGVIGNPWPLENGEVGFMGGDCFSLPDLAISAPGNAMK